MSFSQETLYAIALTRISYFNTATCLQLYRKLGSATAIMENRKNIKDVISDASPRLINALSDVSEALHRAEAELEFDNAHAIRPLTMRRLSRTNAQLRRCPNRTFLSWQCRPQPATHRVGCWHTPLHSLRTRYHQQLLPVA